MLQKSLGNPGLASSTPWDNLLNPLSLRSCGPLSNHLLLPPCLPSPLALAPAEPNLFCSATLPLALPKTVCIGTLNHVLALNLKQHGYENIASEKWMQQRKWARCILGLLAVLGSCLLTTGRPLYLCFVRMSVTDCRSGFSDSLLFIAPHGFSFGFNESPLFWQDRSECAFICVHLCRIIKETRAPCIQPEKDGEQICWCPSKKQTLNYRISKVIWHWQQFNTVFHINQIFKKALKCSNWYKNILIVTVAFYQASIVLWTFDVLCLD